MGRRIEVLDHGYVELVETMGSDERIIEAARMSTGGGFKGWGPVCAQCGSRDATCDPQDPDSFCPDCNEVGVAMRPGDEKLLAYLWRNKHTTPFEMAGMAIEVKAPIFIYRQWHRHRTQSYNEMSARYVPVPNEHYVPSIERLMQNSKKNKQAGKAKGAAQLTEEHAREVQEILKLSYGVADDAYQTMLQHGVPKELARLTMPVSRYSVMRASANLLNWLKFLTLRCDVHAQWEIQQYANAVSELIADGFPRTHALWKETFDAKR